MTTNDVGGDSGRERGGCDSWPSEMAMEPPNHHRERAERSDQGIIGGLHCEGKEGGTETNEQRRNCCRSTIQGQTVHEPRAPTASASSVADRATSRASAATINRSAATVPDHTNRASTGAMWSGAHRNTEQYTAAHKNHARTARGIILHSAESVRSQSRPSQWRGRVGKCNRMDER